jgi:hypothetical protein
MNAHFYTTLARTPASSGTAQTMREMFKKTDAANMIKMIKSLIMASKSQKTFFVVLGLNAFEKRKWLSIISRMLLSLTV